MLHYSRLRAIASHIPLYIKCPQKGETRSCPCAPWHSDVSIRRNMNSVHTLTSRATTRLCQPLLNRYD